LSNRSSVRTRNDSGKNLHIHLPAIAPTQMLEKVKEKNQDYSPLKQGQGKLGSIAKVKRATLKI